MFSLNFHQLESTIILNHDHKATLLLRNTTYCDFVYHPRLLLCKSSTPHPSMIHRKPSGSNSTWSLRSISAVL